MWYPGSDVVLDCSIPDLCRLFYFVTLSCLNQTVHLHRLGRNLHFSHDASSDFVLSIKRMTNALIRLCGCTDWYVPLLFAYFTIR